MLLGVFTTNQDFNSSTMTSLGVEIFAPEQPTSQKAKNLSTWTINKTTNLLQVFYSNLVRCNNKSLTYCPFEPLEFVLPFNI